MLLPAFSPDANVQRLHWAMKRARLTEKMRDVRAPYCPMEFVRNARTGNEYAAMRAAVLKMSMLLPGSSNSDDSMVEAPT
eukprot:749462-Rhodomonas_salina.1